MSHQRDRFGEATGFRLFVRALYHRNYRLFFGGQSVSLLGTWLTRVALSWLVFRLTHSAFLLGFVGFAGLIPIFLLAPIAGVLIDRWNRHTILVVTQITMMILSFTLAALTLTGIITVWQIIVISLVQGIVNGFDSPARQAFVVEIVEKKEDLGNAIALNSSTFNLARLVGPSLAGVLIATVGEGWCFLLDGMSYTAVIGSLFAMVLKQPFRDTTATTVLAGLKQGLTYAFRFPPIQSLLLLLAVVGFAGMPYRVFLPIFAKDILHGGAHTFGFLMAAAGAGAMTGAGYLASRKSIRGLGRIIFLAAGLVGVGLIVFSLSEVVWLSLATMFLVGLGMIVQMASTNTLLQTIVDDDKRGRVMSIYTVAFLGMTPIGSLLAGSVAGLIGTANTILIGGVLCVLGATGFALRLPSLRAAIRPVYARLGILPEVPTDMKTSTDV